LINGLYKDVSKMGAGSSTSNKETEAVEVHTDHDESINCMCLSEDGSILVTGSEDSTARMWSTSTAEAECIGVLK
jgi:WD40 repeat protein